MRIAAIAQTCRLRSSPRPRPARTGNLPPPAAGPPPFGVHKPPTHARVPKFRWQGIGATYDHLARRGNAPAKQTRKRT